MRELKKVLSQVAPYFRTWVSVSLDSHEWYLAGPDGALHEAAAPLHGKYATHRHAGTYRLGKEADYAAVAEALKDGLVTVYTEEPPFSSRSGQLINRWSNTLASKLVSAA